MWSDELLQKCERGLIFIVSAPAGAGKTTLAKRIVETFSSVVLVPSITTRPCRLGEIDGVDYRFVSKEEFEARRDAGDFLEEVFIHGHHYATSRFLIEEHRSRGRHVLLVIDTQGALVIQKQEACVLVFIKPPSIEALDQRLQDRGTESDEERKRRLEWARRELLEEEKFDYCITNDKVDRAFGVLASIIISQTHMCKKRI